MTALPATNIKNTAIAMLIALATLFSVVSFAPQASADSFIYDDASTDTKWAYGCESGKSICMFKHTSGQRWTTYKDSSGKERRGSRYRGSSFHSNDSSNSNFKGDHFERCGKIRCRLNDAVGAVTFADRVWIVGDSVLDPAESLCLYVHADYKGDSLRVEDGQVITLTGHHKKFNDKISSYRKVLETESC